jgi:hypothetical protein
MTSNVQNNIIDEIDEEEETLRVFTLNDGRDVVCDMTTGETVGENYIHEDYNYETDDEEDDDDDEYLRVFTLENGTNVVCDMRTGEEVTIKRVKYDN